MLAERGGCGYAIIKGRQVYLRRRYFIDTETQVKFERTLPDCSDRRQVEDLEVCVEVN